MSETLKAFLLGVLEGLTEFIPVSSTGHLIVFGEALEFNSSIAASFEIFIQLGAILAVVVLYWQRFLLLIPGKGHESGLQGYQGLVKIGLCCLPAFVTGALFHSAIKQYLFSSFTVALALIVGGLVLIVIERGESRARVHGLDSISYRQAFLVGIAQCLALWPGISRSAATIVGGLLLGLDRKTAAEFSFLVAVPVMCAAVAFDLLKSHAGLPFSSWPIFALGFVVAFVTALVAIRFFMRILQNYTLAMFGYYRIVVGLLILAFLLGQ